MKAFIALTLSCLSLCCNIDACTGAKLIAKDGALVHGRTVEFGIDLDISVAVIPRGHAFTGTTPKGKGLSYESKYGSVGIIAFDSPSLLDGLNEKGLAVGTFYFPTFASYATITSENQSKALSPLEFPNWILTQFATIDEVKTALPSVVIAPTVNKSWGSTPPPFHYIVFDKKGNCLVIEPLNGTLVTYDDKMGTFTNSPTFDWHLTNMRNFINLSPNNSETATLNGVSFAPLGEGSGMVGLPGDFTPPSRFVQAAIFSGTAIPSATAKEAVFQLFHILNQFDIPVGVARSDQDGIIHTDKTLFTCVRDPQSLQYYFRSYNDQNLKVVDLNQFDLNAKGIKSLDVTGVNTAENISEQLHAMAK